MKTVQEIYDAYRIMPNLQLHQLRVGAVGNMICDHFSGELDKECVLLACVFHDMGNIIKFDLEYFPDFSEPQGMQYWESVKRDFVATYGNDEHAASNAIAKEIGLPEPVRALIDETRFSRLEAARESTAFEGKIVKYADLRVSPFGILPMNGRLEEGRERYAKKKAYDTPEGEERYRLSIEAAHEIEKQIFERCSIRPEHINDESAKALVEELRKYPVA